MSAEIIHLRCRPKSTPAWSNPAYRHLRLPVQRESKAWRAIAARHEEARQQLNGSLMRAGSVGTSEIDFALDRYRSACREVLSYRNAKPRHLPFLVRCAAELADALDPAWNHFLDASFKESGPADQALAVLYLQANAVLSR